jgi:hypothetical protein
MRGPTPLSVERESDGIEHSVDLLDYSTRKTVTAPIWIDGATRLQLIWTCVSVICVPEHEHSRMASRHYKSKLECFDNS